MLLPLKLIPKRKISNRNRLLLTGFHIIFNKQFFAMKNLIYLLAAWGGTFLLSCSNDDEPTATKPEFFIESNQILELDVAQINSLIALAGITGFDDLIDQPVKVYEMTYLTNYKGELVEASGLLAIPAQAEGPIPILSVQHGTITKASEAPTLNLAFYLPFASLATAGYVILIPDYLGFGSSENIFHPYFIGDLYATTIIDMIRGGEEFMELEGFTWSEKIFLAGYSEGGYATMATHKYLEENPTLGLPVTASAPAAGGYDLFHMQDYFFGLTTYHNPHYMPYVIQSYSLTQDWIQPLTDFFQEPYATDIPDLFDGSLSGDEIDQNLTDTVANLLTATFLNEFDTAIRYTPLRLTMVSNTLVEWVPIAPMRMYHGTDDITVPFENSEVTFDKLIANGTSPQTLELIPIQGATHTTGLIPMVESVIPWFEGQK